MATQSSSGFVFDLGRHLTPALGRILMLQRPLKPLNGSANDRVFPQRFVECVIRVWHNFNLR